ncbi:MAG: acyl-CoA dehydrogenase [Halobacteriovoraceae bacterium]|nr:acyl-CoA dehydrogenase [Halobacteriovoraceae bacterium]
MVSLLVGAFVAVFIVLAYIGVPLWLWAIYAAAGLFSLGATPPAWIVFGVVALVFLTPVRRVISSVVMNILIKLKFIPKISDTELQALKAGDVWVERELFSGSPDFKKMKEAPYPKLTEEEQAFLDGPVEEICKMTDDWEVWQDGDLPPSTWRFLKQNKFFGMIIPKEYGGLGFSHFAHSEVIQKLSSRSVPLCVTVMVPNSLGPAELLLHYGTDEQKKTLLPRLAVGDEIPCFALTEPTAGSDAGSITSSGEVFKGEDGKLYLKMNWNKRWITLAAKSTLMGMAFRMFDPENHLGKGEDLGITCALIPRNSEGVKADRRHDPLGVPFFNCPTHGTDVVVPLDTIIGGPEMAGRGWEMLMGCLAAGRGISLPAQSTGGSKAASLVVSSHATLRKQFGMSIGNFEGVQAPIGEIVGLTYALEAARKYTLSALDAGIKPPVVTAMLKYWSTEIARKNINHAMDVVGGAGISRGPNNLLAHGYIALPIGVTVEGANILTRTLIIFGQGAIRAHKYVYNEFEAIQNKDLKMFDKAFWGHVGLVFNNTFRALILSLTRGYSALGCLGQGKLWRYYQKLTWASSVFALFTDFALSLLGGTLKAKGQLSGRFADVFSWMYFASSTLRRYEEEGQKKEDLPLVLWTLERSFYEIKEAIDGILENFTHPVMKFLISPVFKFILAVNPIGSSTKDEYDFKLARMIQNNVEQRKRLNDGIFVPTEPTERMAQLETAFHLFMETKPIHKKVRSAAKAKKIRKNHPKDLYTQALEASIITQEEFDKVKEVNKMAYDVIQVDDFPADSRTDIVEELNSSSAVKPSAEVNV